MTMVSTHPIITDAVGAAGNCDPEPQHLPHSQDVIPVLAAVVGEIADPD